MFGLNRKKSILGLDIGRNQTKIVQLDYSGKDNPILARCDILETGLLDESFEGKMKAHLKEHKLSGSLVASSIDDPSMKIRKMELPKMPDLELIEAIKWNLRDIVDGEIENFSVNYSRITEDESGEDAKVALTAYAINKEAIMGRQQLIQSLGLQVFFIEPSAVTLSSTLERCHAEDEGYIAGVNIGFHSSLFFVIGKGVFVFSRPLIGINMRTQKTAPESFNQKLAIEIQKSIDTFKVNFKMVDIKKIYISGEGALISEIKDYLNMNLGVETNLMNPFLSLSNVEAFKEVPAPLCAEAVGLAYLQP